MNEAAKEAREVWRTVKGGMEEERWKVRRLGETGGDEEL